MTTSTKQRFRVLNWKDYNEAWVQRGSITFWFDAKALSQWHNVGKTKKRGRPKVYTDIAIQCALILRAVYHLPLCATEGLVRSLIKQLDLPIQAPDYTTLCIRQKTLPLSACQNHRACVTKNYLSLLTPLALKYGVKGSGKFDSMAIQNGERGAKRTSLSM